MRQILERVLMYAEESVRNAEMNLHKLTILHAEIYLAKQNIGRVNRNNMIHGNYNYDFETYTSINKMKENEQMFDTLKNAFVNNICFALSYASEILLFDLANNSEITNTKTKVLFSEIYLILSKIDLEMNIPLYALIPKLVEVETKILSSEQSAKYLHLRIVVRDIKSKIEK